MAVLSLGLAVLIGLSLGMLGGGGSIMAVPILVYVAGFGAKQAIAMSLGVVGVTSLFGAIGHWRAGNVSFRIALVFGAVAMGATYLAARLAVFLSGGVQLILFAAVMLVAGFFMIRQSSPAIPEGGGADANRAMPLLLITLVAIGVGAVTGLVGVGGGFLIVPALVLLGRVPMKQAIGTSLLVIAMNSAAGFSGYLGQVEMPWVFMSVFTAIAAAGILAGTYLVQFVSPAALKRSFAALLIVVGVFILYQNRAVLLQSSDGGQHVEQARSTK